MEIYILDALLRPIDLIDDDQFISFIWAERYAERGDFELVTLSSPSMKNRFVEDTMITIADSKRVMRVKTILEKIDEEKGATLTIKGFDLSSILDERVSGVLEVDGNLRAVTYWNGWSPIDLITDMVWRACVTDSGWLLSPGDAIPFLNNVHTTPGSLYPASNIPEPEPGGILWEQKLDTLYNAVKAVCEAYDLGFRFYKDPSTAKLYFEGYNGVDRTTAQAVYPPVVFSSDMENLQNTSEFQDTTGHRNLIFVSYVYKNPVEGGYPTELTTTVSVSDPQLAFSSGGFDQKTKVITVSQIPDGVTDIPAYLTQLGNEELTKSRPTDVYDGEVDQNSQYVYERDYNLGDIVEIRGDNGGGAYMRVVEQIIKFDANGKASYPSLVNKDSITPGTWRSWKYDIDWSAMGSGEYWNNQ